MIGVDGVLIFDSSNINSWPVLVSLENDQSVYKIFPISATMGAKPSCVSYVNQCVGELSHLLRDGFIYKGNHHRVCLMCIVCDAPARAFMKSIMGHMAAHSCERGLCKATKVGGRMVFYKTENFDLQSDDTFRRKDYTQNTIILSAWTVHG